MKENLVYCRTDYEMLFQGEYFQSLSDELSCHPEGHLPFYNGVGTVQKGRPRKRKTHLPDGDVCPPGMGKLHKPQKILMPISTLILYISMLQLQ